MLTYIESLMDSLGSTDLFTCRLGRPLIPPPPTTALGALLHHVTKGAEAETFQPMNVNFGLLPPPTDSDGRGRPVRGREKKKAVTRRALSDLEAWLDES